MASHDSRPSSSARRSTVERVLEVLDVGLQRSTSHGPGAVGPSSGFCVRCASRLPADAAGDLCPGCRAFLLGDSDADPATDLYESSHDGQGWGWLIVNGEPVGCRTLFDPVDPRCEP